MSILDWFSNQKKETFISPKLDIPSDLWVKCYNCGEILYLKELLNNYKVCTKCDYYFRLTPEERIAFTFDKDTFSEKYQNIKPVDFLEFSDTVSYASRLLKAQQKTKRNDAVLVGTAKINNEPVNVGVMDFDFMGGSMGSVVGEKLTRLFEDAIQNKNPVIVVTTSGGARMQEGILSLMQMAKTSSALSKLAEAKVPYFVILTDPTTGGTTASFAMLGDIIIAEPNALISFAGPRVIEQTIKQKLPPGFQRSEFLRDHGFVDLIVERKNLKGTIFNLIKMLKGNRKLES
ncbi:MAG: acetyl-CoA carboxylase, carboxyltransferase subunit beta [Candidatus Margulisiibacteriota bacterium]|jgi:acetyl-CoA carboxylase carboxyl transferase subunit beta